MSEQPKQTYGNKTVYRWRLDTTLGPKVTWAENEDAARAKVAKAGGETISIRPAGSALTD